MGLRKDETLGLQPQLLEITVGTQQLPILWSLLWVFIRTLFIAWHQGSVSPWFLVVSVSSSSRSRGLGGVCGSRVGVKIPLDASQGSYLDPKFTHDNGPKPTKTAQQAVCCMLLGSRKLPEGTAWDAEARQS